MAGQLSDAIGARYKLNQAKKTTRDARQTHLTAPPVTEVGFFCENAMKAGFPWSRVERRILAFSKTAGRTQETPPVAAGGWI